CLIRGGDAGSAVALQGSVEESPQSALQQFALGTLAFATGDATACEGHLRSAFLLGSDSSGDAFIDGGSLLGELYLMWGRVADAEKQVQAVLAQCPAHARQYPSLLGKRAIALIAQNRVREARDAIDDPVFPQSVASCSPEQLEGLFVRACTR